MQNSDGQSGHVSSIEVEALQFGFILPDFLRRGSTKHAKTGIGKEYGFLVFHKSAPVTSELRRITLNYAVLGGGRKLRTVYS